MRNQILGATQKGARGLKPDILTLSSTAKEGESSGVEEGVSEGTVEVGAGCEEGRYGPGRDSRCLADGVFWKTSFFIDSQEYQITLGQSKS